MENSKLSDVKGKELVAAGHAFAKAMGMDTALIDIAKMVSELATRLDCALVRGDALAAENAALKVSRQAVVNAFDDAMNEFGMARGETAADYPAPETPATAAYLNSVRVEAVESFAHQQRVKADAATGEVQRTYRISAGFAEDYAAQLRAGKDGE